MKQRIAAAAVMVPRSGRWAELDCDDGVYIIAAAVVHAVTTTLVDVTDINVTADEHQ